MWFFSFFFYLSICSKSIQWSDHKEVRQWVCESRGSWVLHSLIMAQIISLLTKEHIQQYLPRALFFSAKTKTSSKIVTHHIRLPSIWTTIVTEPEEKSRLVLISHCLLPWLSTFFCLLLHNSSFFWCLCFFKYYKMFYCVCTLICQVPDHFFKRFSIFLSILLCGNYF